MYDILNQSNPVVQQMIQREKEAYIADNITKRLLCENCTQQEYRNILKTVENEFLINVYMIN